MTDLSLVSIDDIQNELDKRYSVVVLLTIKKRNNEDIAEHHGYGSQMAIIGICENYTFQLKIQNRLEEVKEFDQD